MVQHLRDLTIPELFSRQVADAPDQPAVLDGESYLSYADLDRLTNQVAQQLATEGVSTGKIVATAIARSSEAVVLWLAILKLGAAYLPIDPANPPAVIAAMLEDAEPAIVVTDRDLHIGPNSAGGTRIVSLSNLVSEASTQSTSLACAPVKATSPAYVMFTSGSTGRPKGAVVHHRGVIRLVCNQSYVTFSQEAIFLQISALTFDASTFEIWGALLNGGSIAIVPGDRLSIPQIGKAIAHYGATTILFTSALFNAIVDVDIEAMTGLREIVIGGDVVSPTHVARAMARFPNVQFINAYGPTEAATASVCHRITANDVKGGSVPIGTALNNTSLYILDDDMRPVADGQIGELWIGGDGVGLGYLKRPELTAARFRADPFAQEPGATMYGTGDIVLRRPDGLIEFHGRNDRQVKIDGKRIELDAIEHAFRSSAAVEDIAVSTLTSDSGSKQIIAFVKAAKTATVDNYAKRLTTELSATLPHYMLPQKIVMVPELPLTPNGKVDKTALMQIARR